jgi:hypothetical protein
VAVELGQAQESPAIIMDAAEHRAHSLTVDRYNLALLLLTFAAIPLFYVSAWLGVAAVIAIYCLIARLANRDFNRRFRKQSSPGANKVL